VWTYVHPTFFSSDPLHARICWSELEEHRRSFSVLKLVRTVTLRTPTLVGLFSVLLWDYIVHKKKAIASILSADVCSDQGDLWVCLQVGHRRVQHPGHTNGGDDKIARTNPGMLRTAATAAARGRSHDGALDVS
jgi:hypothetical protein